jgi:hypothetical protein
LSDRSGLRFRPSTRLDRAAYGLNKSRPAGITPGGVASAFHDTTQALVELGARSVLAVAAPAVQGLGDARTLRARAPVFAC